MTSLDDLYILPPCKEEIEILHSDKEFLLINKPAGLLSVPGRHPQNCDSVISRLQQQYPSAAIVHRLDFDTSGILLIPLNRSALSHISKQFQARTVSKHYTAVVGGIVEQDDGLIDLPIAKGEGAKYKICTDNGKPSQTEYRVIARDFKAGTTRLLLHPITGRSHQLRLHLNAIGHPILGCEFYGDKFKNSASRLSRLLLHATDLRFFHPQTNANIFFECAPQF